MKNTSIGQLIMCILIPFLGLIAFGGIVVAMLVAYLAPAASTDMEKALLMLSKNTVFFLNMIPFFIGFGFLLFAARFFAKTRLKSFISSRDKIDWRRFGFSFLVWSVLSFGFFAIDYFSNPAVYQLKFDGAIFSVLLVLSLIAIPIQTGFEEIIFRGFLLKLSQRFFANFLLICSINGLFFGAMHLANPEIALFGWPAFLYFVVTGMFLAAITLIDKGVELAWGFHAANNLFGVLIVTNNWQVLQTNALFIDTRPPEIGMNLLWTMLVAYPLLFVLLAKYYRWDLAGIFSRKRQ